MEAFRIFSNPGKYGAFGGVGERVALRRDAVALAAQFAFEHRHDVAGLFLVACCVFIAPRILARENPSGNLFLFASPTQRNRSALRHRGRLLAFLWDGSVFEKNVGGWCGERKRGRNRDGQRGKFVMLVGCWVHVFSPWLFKTTSSCLCILA